MLAPFFSLNFERAGATAERISAQGFELIAGAWLSELTHEDLSKSIDESHRWLIESGLYAALSGGTFSYQIAA